jgi:Ser/Thr protein kinase RdoA (MazF antagonist)
MKNVTITLDEEVARWARIRAAELNTSVSRLLGQLLERLMLEEENYHAAMQQYLSGAPQMLNEAGTEYPKREQLHDRDDLR